MYLEWSSGKTSRNPDVKAAFDQARAETKDILKRISNTNVRPMARALAKIAFANPHIVITTALTQIEVYDSIAEVFVEGARYFTDLGYDVLTWAIVSSMAKTGRNRTQEGGIFASRWLQALAVFAGRIYKRYGMMKPGPILQYVAEQLEKGNTMDLKMLEQIVLSMAGISTDTSYNDSQLQAMGGGPLLQAQTILQLLDRRHDSRKTSERLVKSLQDTGLTAKFLISMAQQRQACVFEDGQVPLKAIGNTYDEVHRVMTQYLDLLSTSLTPDEFQATIPNVASLLIDYDIRPEIAFWVGRPLVARQMMERDQETSKDQPGEDQKAVNGDIDMSDHINANSEEDGEAAETENFLKNSPAAGGVTASSMELESDDKTPGPTDTAPEDCWHPVMQDLMTAIQPSLPEEVVETMGTGFYTTFWQLSLYDIAVPVGSYSDEIARQDKIVKAIERDRSDVSVSGTKKKQLALSQAKELKLKLDTELKKQFKASSQSKARLQREKGQWFLGKARMDKPLNTALMEHCFLPRLLSSPLDAYFCFKFLKNLHSIGTPNFRTLGFYDLFFKPARLVSLIFMCTSKEADNFGKFLSEVLKELGSWHGSRTTYEKSAWGKEKDLPGFALRVEAGKVITLLDFEKFQQILFKWHSNLFTALQKCLTSPEYMHVRNAISVLRAISVVYPAVNWHGTGLQKVVDKLHESDKEDLKVSSQALLGALHRREKMWVAQEIFRKGPEKKAEHESEPSQAKTASTQDAVPGDAKVSKEAEDAFNDTPMTDVAPKPETQPVAEEKAAAESSKPIPQLTNESSRGSSRATSRPTITNGASTPTRQSTEMSAGPKRDPRSLLPDLPKPHDLPRRLTPPPLRSTLAGLPNRPELVDARNGHRDSPRLSTRAEVEHVRPPPDARIIHGRDARPGYRGSERSDRPEHGYEDYDRHSRRYERPDVPPQPGREERGYGREHERRGQHDRPQPPGQDRPAVRLPPADRDRENREPVPRSRPPSAPETLKLEPQAPPKKDTPTEPMINPARASLIESASDQRPRAGLRIDGQERPSRSSRPSSPRREDERKPYSRRDGDDRPRQEASSTRQPLHGPPLVEATAPNPRSSGPHPYKRESRESRQNPAVDMQHGRLEQEYSPRAPLAQSSERPQESEVPSGPRGRPPPGSGPRMRAPPLNTQVPPPSNADRPTPTGPSRRHGRTSSYAEAPATPSAPAAEASGVHPSRLNQIDSATPEPLHTTQVTQPQLQPAPPPAGPRGNAPLGAPSGPSPTSRAPPTGPHANDIGGRGGRNNRNPLTTVNNTLAQAGTSTRGNRGNMRQTSANFGAHMPPPLPPPPPGGPPGPSQSPGANGYQAHDLFGSSNPNDVPVGNRPPSARPDSSRGDRRSNPMDERGTERRSSRHPVRHDESRGDRELRSERDNRDGREDRHGGADASRREERPGRRESHLTEGDDRRTGHPRSDPPRDDMQSSRKHGREEESNAYGRSLGPGNGGGRGGSRVSSESKRPRRGI